jgi:hypothetical protein
MRRAAWVLTLVLVALVAGACGDEDGDNDKPGVVRGTGYQYELPEGWADESDSDASELDLGGFRPDTIAADEPKAGFPPNVNVILEPSLSTDVTPRVYANASHQILRNPSVLRGEARRAIERLDPRDFGSERRLDLDGREAYQIDYTGNQGGRVLRFRGVTTVKDKTGYAVSYTALRTHFDEGLDDFEQILDSWRWR